MVSYSSLPEEILIDILTRLPVKSLIRFKCVSKHMYTIITNPSFITTHLHHSNSNPKLRLLLKIPRYNIKSSHGALLLRNLKTLDDLDVPFINESNSYVSVVGSCNGLVCVSLSREGTNIVLWNPVIRQFSHLPMPLFTNLERPGETTTFSLGFGFSLNKEYKLVRMVQISCEMNFKVLVEVFTWSKGCWREINDVLCKTSEYLHPVAVNGVLHWLASDPLYLASRSRSRKLIILSFDMVTEVFHRTSLAPCYEDCDKVNATRLTVWKESLAIFAFSLGEGLDMHIAIWVMNENGVGDCWAKLFTIGPFFEPLVLLGNWNCHGFLLHFCKSDYLFFCDPISQEKKKILKLGSKFHYEAHDYVESLVSV